VRYLRVRRGTPAESRIKKGDGCEEGAVVQTSNETTKIGKAFATLRREYWQSSHYNDSGVE
jgi:hypothetical protein